MNVFDSHGRTAVLFAAVMLLSAAACTAQPEDEAAGGIAAQAVSSQAPGGFTVFAAGLDNPRGLHFGKDQKLYVVEAGVGGPNSTVGLCPQFAPPLGPTTSGHSARITRLGPQGQEQTWHSGLFSFAQAPASGMEINGMNDLAFDGPDVLALVLGGCHTGSLTQQSEVLRLRPNGSSARVVNLSQWYRSTLPAVQDDVGFNPDGVPYRILRDGAHYYIAEANHSVLDRLNPNGTLTRIADFSALFPGGFEFTPSALAQGPDGAFYVGTFGAIPYPEGGAKILQVTPTGQTTIVAEGLNLIQGLEFDCAGDLYVLEAATAGLTFPAGTGRVLRREGDGWVEVVTGLTRPSAMTFGPDGRLYVSNNGFGVGPVAGQGAVVIADLGLGKQRCR